MPDKTRLGETLARRKRRKRRPRSNRETEYPRLYERRLEQRLALDGTGVLPPVMDLDAGGGADDALDDVFRIAVVREDGGETLRAYVNDELRFEGQVDSSHTIRIEGSQDHDRFYLEHDPSNYTSGGTGAFFATSPDQPQKLDAVRYVLDDGTSEIRLELQTQSHGISEISIVLAHIDAVNDTLLADERSFTFVGNDSAVTLADNADPADNVSRLYGFAGPSIEFAGPGRSLALAYQDNLDVAAAWNLQGLDAQFVADVQILGDANDVVRVTGDFGVEDGDVTVETAGIEVMGTVYSSHGNLELIASDYVDVHVNGRLATADGDILVRAPEINQRGSVSAGADSTVELNAGETGALSVSGSITAIGIQATDTGGSVFLLGDRIEILAGSEVDVSGPAGGGVAYVGGGLRGLDSQFRNASQTLIERDARLVANAHERGRGGRVVVWSEEETRFFGRIEADGGRAGGDGGFIEVSGDRYLAFGGQVSLSSVNGDLGTLLLDPTDIHIINDTTQDIGAGDVNFDDAGSSTITVGTLESISANITLQASHTITIDDLGVDVGLPSNIADQAINLKANVTLTLETRNAGGETGGITFADPNDSIIATGTGSIIIRTGVSGGEEANLTTLGNLQTAGGNINLEASGSIDVDGNLTTSGGDIQLTADSNSDGAGGVNLAAALTTGAAGGDILIQANDLVLGNLPLSSGTGGITFSTNTLTVDSSATLSGTGNLVISPGDASTTIGIGGAAGTLNLDDALLATFADGFSSITIGDTTNGTGDVIVSAATFADAVTIAGGSITVLGLNAGTNTATLVANGGLIREGGPGTAVTAEEVILSGQIAPGASPGSFVVDGDVTLSGSDVFQVELNGTTAGTGYDQLSVIGSDRTVDLGGATLNLSLGYMPNAGHTLTIVDNVSSDSTIVNTFNGLADGDTVLVDGTPFQINYNAGTDNNDVVLTYADPSAINTGSGDDTIVVRRQGAILRVTVNGSQAFSAPLAGLTDLTINSEAGNDTLIIDGTGGIFQIPITYNGGTGDDVLRMVNPAGAILPVTVVYNGGADTDSLELTGGGGVGVTEIYSVGPTHDAGTISTSDGGIPQSITFTGLEPIDTTVQADLIINATDAANVINVTDGAVGRIRVGIDAFEVIEFANKSNVTINAGDGTPGADLGDTINLNYTENPAGFGWLNLNAAEGDDVVRVQAALTGTVSILGGSGHDTFFVDAGFTGTIDGEAGTDILRGTEMDAVTLTGSDVDGFAGSEADISGGFDGIDSIVGNGGTLTGRDVASTWDLDATPTYQDGVGTLNFSGFTVLQGGSAADQFRLTVASSLDLQGGEGDDGFRLDVALTGSIDGENGSDRIDFSAAAVPVVADLDGGTATNVSGTVLNVENFTGSASGDALSVDALAAGVTRDVVGGAGSDTLTIDAQGQVATDNGSSVSFSGGYGTISYSNWEQIIIVNGGLVVVGDNADNILIVNATTADAGNYQLDSGPLISFSGIASFTFDAQGGDDLLVIINPTLSTFNPINGVFYNAGADSLPSGDSLHIIGGTAATATFQYRNAADGVVDVDGNLADSAQINYTELENILSSLNTADVELNYSSQAETITVAGLSAIQTRVLATAGVATTLGNPGSSLTIRGGDVGDDTIVVNSVSSGFAADLTLDGQDGSDALSVNGSLDLGSGALTIQDVENVDILAQITAGGGIDIRDATTTRLAADLRTDGGDVSINAGDVVIGSALVTIDTEADNSGNAGSVLLAGTRMSADAAARNLAIDASTGDLAGLGGAVSLGEVTNTSGALLGNLTIRAAGSTCGDVTLSNQVEIDGALLVLDVDTVDIDGDVTAGSTLTIRDVTTRIDLGQDVDLTALGGDLLIPATATQVDLTGTGGTNRLVSSGGLVAVLAPVVDSGSFVALQIDAETHVALGDVDIAGALIINVDTGTDGVSLLNATANVRAGAMTITGQGNNDAFSFDATLTSTTGAISIDGAETVRFVADVSAADGLSVQNVADSVQLAADVDLIALAGDLLLPASVSQVDLTGVGGTNSLQALDGSVTVATMIVDSGSPGALRVEATGSVLLDNVEVSSKLVVNVDIDDNSVETGTFDRLVAGTIQIAGGTDGNEVLSFDSGGITSANTLSVRDAAQVELDAALYWAGGDMDIATGVGEIVLIGADATTTTLRTTNDGQLDLAALRSVNDPGPDVRLESQGGLTAAGFDLNSGALDIFIDFDNDAVEVGQFTGPVSAGAILIMGSGDDVLQFTAGGVQAGSTLTLNMAQRVELASALYSAGGDMDIATSIGGIVLTGADGTTTLRTTNDGAIQLASLGTANDPGPDLTIESQGGLTVAAIDLNSGTLDIQIDTDSDATELALFNASVVAGTIGVNGSTDDTVRFVAGVTAGGTLDVKNVQQIDLASTLYTAGGDLDMRTGVGEILLSGLVSTTVTVRTTNDGALQLATVRSANTPGPNLWIDSQGDVLTGGIDLNAGTLDVDVDADNDGIHVGEFNGLLTARTIQVDGSGNDVLRFLTGGVVAGQTFTANHATRVELDSALYWTRGDMDIATGVGEIVLIGADATTTTLRTTNDGQLDLAALRSVNDPGPDVRLESQGGLTAAGFDLNSGALDIFIDFDNDAVEVGQFTGPVSAGAILIMGSGDDVLQFTAGGVQAGSTLTLNMAQRVELASALYSAGGDMDIATSIGGIVLTGADGTTTTLRTTNDGAIQLASLGTANDPGPDLTIESQGGLTVAAIDLNSGTLDIQIDTDSDATELALFNASVVAGTIGISGSTDDTVRFVAGVTAGGTLDVNDVQQIDLASTLYTAGGDLDMRTGVGEILLSGLVSTTVTVRTTNDGALQLATVRSANTPGPNLWIDSQGDVLTGGIDLNAGTLDVDVDADNDGIHVGEFNGLLTARTIQVDGSGNDVLRFLTGGVVAGQTFTANHATRVELDSALYWTRGDMDIATGVGEIVLIGADATTTTLRTTNEGIIDLSSIRSANDPGPDLTIDAESGLTLQAVDINSGTLVLRVDSDSDSAVTADLQSTLSAGAILITTGTDGNDQIIAHDVIQAHVTDVTIENAVYTRLMDISAQGAITVAVPAIDLYGTSYTAASSVTLSGATVLNAAGLTVIRGDTGIVTGGTVDGRIAGRQQLDLTSVSGEILIAQPIGDSVPLGGLTVVGDRLNVQANLTTTAAGGGDGRIVLSQTGNLPLTLGVQLSSGGGVIDVSAAENVRLLSSARLSSSGGDITLRADRDATNSGGSLFITSGAVVDAGSGVIVVEADGDITVAGLRTSRSTGTAVSVTSVSGSLSGHGTQAHIVAPDGTVVIQTLQGVGNSRVLRTTIDTLRVDNSGPGSSGDVRILESDGLQVGQVLAGGGRISLTANNDILLTGLQTTNAGADAVTVTSLVGGIVDGGTGLDISALNGTAVLNAVTGVGSHDALETNVAALRIRNIGGGASGDIRISETDADTLSVLGITQQGPGDIYLEAGGRIEVTGIATNGASSTAVTLVSVNDGIVDGGDSEVDIAARGTVVLDTIRGVGAFAGAGADRAIETNVSALHVTNTRAGADGDVVIRELDDLSIQRIHVTGGGAFDGTVDVATGGNLLIAPTGDGVRATNGGDILLHAGNHLIVGDTAAADDLRVFNQGQIIGRADGRILAIGHPVARTSTGYVVLPLPLAVNVEPVDLGGPNINVDEQGNAALDVTIVGGSNFQIIIDWNDFPGAGGPISYPPNNNLPPGGDGSGGNPPIFAGAVTHRFDYQYLMGNPSGDPVADIPYSVTVMFDFRGNGGTDNGIQFFSSGEHVVYVTPPDATFNVPVQGIQSFTVERVASQRETYVPPPPIMEPPPVVESVPTTSTTSLDVGTPPAQVTPQQIRKVELRLVSPTGEEIALDETGDIDILNDLERLFGKLPDDRYRIYLILEDGTQQLVVDVVLRGHKPVGPLEEFEQDRSRPPRLRRDAAVPVSAPAEVQQDDLPGASIESAEEPLPAADGQTLPVPTEDATASGDLNRDAGQHGTSDALSGEAIEWMGVAAGGLAAQARRARRADKSTQRLSRNTFSKGARLRRRLER